MNAEFIKALIKARSEFPVIRKDSTNPHFKSRYASLDTINEAIIPVLTKNGLIVVQPTVKIEGEWHIQTQILHESGDSMEFFYPITFVEDPQKFGSKITYARRYSLCCALNLTADDDDDGNSASQPAPEKKTAAPQSQNHKVIKELIDELGGIEVDQVKTIVSSMGVASSADLTLPQLDEVLCRLMVTWGAHAFNAPQHARNSLNKLISENKGTPWQEIAKLWKVKVQEKIGEPELAKVG